MTSYRGSASDIQFATHGLNEVEDELLAGVVFSFPPKTVDLQRDSLVP